MSGRVGHTRNRAGCARRRTARLIASHHTAPQTLSAARGLVPRGPERRNTVKKVGVILSAGVLASLVAGAALAGTPRIDHREAMQRARISQGVRSGQLTRREQARLNAGQRRIHRAERRAAADGKFTRAERRRIERMQDRENRAIRRLKHNGRGRA